MEAVVQQIAYQVSSLYDVDITEASRRGPVVEARQAVMNALLTRCSQNKVARLFGKTHATVIHAKNHHTFRLNDKNSPLYKTAFELANSILATNKIPEIKTPGVLLEKINQQQETIERQSKKVAQLKYELQELMNEVTQLRKYKQMHFEGGAL